MADDAVIPGISHTAIKKGSNSTPEPTNLIHISSELKMPLQDIMGCTDMLRESELSSEQVHYVDAILAASDILMDINEDLLDSLGSKGSGRDRKTKIKPQRKSKAMTVPPKYQTAISTHISGKKQRLDLNPVLEDCLGQVDLLEELIGLFKANALEFIGEVKIHLQTSDFKGIAFASHKIKNGLRMLQIADLLTIAEQMDIQARTDKDIKHLKFLFGCFISEYPAIEAHLDAAVLKFKKN